MKKLFIAILIIFTIIFFTYLFSQDRISNSDIVKITVQKYDQDGLEVRKEKVIDEIESLKTFKRILDSAIYEKDRHPLLQLAHHHDYQITISHENKSTDELRVWIESGRYTKLFRESNENWYEIKNEQSREELLHLFK